MPTLKLTKSTIDAHLRESVPALLWDTRTQGFGIRINGTGKAAFIAQGRVQGRDKSARLTIGPYGIFTLEEAREVAREQLRLMRLGTDPRDLKKQDEAMALTLGQVMEAYVSRPGKLKAGTAAEYRRQVEKSLGAWKDKPIVDITEDDVRRRHREIVEHGSTGKGGPAPVAANATMRTLRILMNFAGRQYRRSDGSPLIARNPVGVMKDHWSPMGTRTDRYVGKREIGKVWNALVAARGEARNRDALSSIDLTLFALLTGARREEMASLTWDRVNIDEEDPSNCWWHIEERKVGDPLWLPLSSQAVDLLKSRMPKNRKEASPYVFPSWSKKGYIADARVPMRIVSEVAGKHLSLHDMRRTFTNISLRECLIEKFRTDLLTGHKPSQEDVTARNYLDLARLDWLQPEVQKIGDWIEQQAAIASGENVVELPQGSAVSV